MEQSVELPHSVRSKEFPFSEGFVGTGLCLLKRPEIQDGNVIDREHDCPGYCEWIPGLRDLDHWRLRRDRSLLDIEERREFQQESWIRRERKWDRIARIVELTIITVLVLATVFGAVFQSGHRISLETHVVSEPDRSDVDPADPGLRIRE